LIDISHAIMETNGVSESRTSLIAFSDSNTVLSSNQQEVPAMPRLNAVPPQDATGPVKEIYEGVTKKMGKVPNIFQGMANSPAALKAYLSMSEALSGGQLAVEDREAIYLAVSEQNGCHYCVSAHTLVAKRVGLQDEAIQAVRKFQSPDDKQQVLLDFVGKVIETKGFVSDTDLQQVRQAGYGDGQLAEAVGYIALATYSNLFNHVHDTPLDFPAAPEL
jgi:uncharacterized peroxidase-related enzyme